VVALACTIAGALNEKWHLAYLGLSLFLWFVLEGALFAYRIRAVLPAAVFQRQLRDSRGPVDSLWAGRVFEVKVVLRLPAETLPYLRIVDRVPFNVERLSGRPGDEGKYPSDARVEFSYTIRCTNTGKVRFEGVALHAADLQGFFYHHAFLAAPLEFRVLPPLVDAEGKRPMLKRTNLLPSPGQHRQLQPGSGSELLDLRDYLPGDPPKTIAWKVSARRDRLITKEFESEVPVRCHMFVDVSQSVRVGFEGANALGRIADISAAIAQATAAQRDLIGLCLVDEQSVRRVLRPSRSRRHVIEILHELAEAAALAPASGAGSVDQLLPLAHALAEEVYPQLLQPPLNRIPSWLPWLWPGPVRRHTWWPPRFSLRTAVWYGLGAVPLLALAIPIALLWPAIEPFVQILVVVPGAMLLPVLVGFLLGAGLFYFLGWGVLGRLVGHFFSFARRRRFRWRKQLAAVLAQRYGGGSGALSHYLEDDAALVARLQQFLAEHHVPYPVPLYDSSGKFALASPGKVAVLAEALLSAVARGRDNELFILLVDLVELDGWLEPLLRAVKVARARHHQVMLVCPWPHGALPPGEIHEKLVIDARSPEQTLVALTQRRWLRGFLRVRKTFTRLGVPVLPASDRDVPRLILDRLDRLRYLGMGSRQ
jgi:uncharacterized protein (DUF58 family)